MKKIIIVILVIAGIAEGCKKYEDGPLFSFRSAKHRLYGDYTLTKYTIDGVDSLQQMKTRYGLYFHFYYEENNKVDDLMIDGGNSPELFVCRYYFINHKKGINLSNHGSFLFTGWGALNPEAVDIEILELKNDEIHMRTTFNNKEYYFELK